MNKIMVVDDDVDVLDCVTYILKRNNFEVISLSDCRQAVSTLADRQPDLILLDVNLGFCDGRQLCMHLKNDHSFNRPILLFSANPELVASPGAYNADDFIQKPFSINNFLQVIRSHMPVE